LIIAWIATSSDLDNDRLLGAPRRGWSCQIRGGEGSGASAHAGASHRYVFRDGEPVLKEFRFKLEADGRDAYSFSSDDPPSPKGWRQVPVD
jgi:hypothetical protein